MERRHLADPLSGHPWRLIIMAVLVLSPTFCLIMLILFPRGVLSIISWVVITVFRHFWVILPVSVTLALLGYLAFVSVLLAGNPASAGYFLGGSADLVAVKCVHCAGGVQILLSGSWIAPPPELRLEDHKNRMFRSITANKRNCPWCAGKGFHWRAREEEGKT